MEDPAYQSLEDDLVGGLIADLANPDILSPEDTLTVYLDTLQKLDLKEMTSYLGVVNIMNTSDTAKNSIASALAEQIHKNFNYVIKSSSENGYNATVTTEITTFDSDSILADYQESLINIWLLLTQLSMAPRNDTRNLSKFF